MFITVKIVSSITYLRKVLACVKCGVTNRKSSMRRMRTLIKEKMMLDFFYL